MKKVTFSSVIFSLFLFSCAQAPKINPTMYPVTPQDTVKVEIPKACKHMYKTSIPKVAVVDFQNNTTFDYAEVIQQSKRIGFRGSATSAGVGGAVVGPGGVVGGYVSSTEVQGRVRENSETVSRKINTKLGESIAESVTARLAQMGGLIIYTRRDLQKVLQEQKLQTSGLVDPATAVKIGKLAGVKYIVTGSINNIELKWFEVGEETKRGLSQNLGTLGSLLAFATSTQEGWNLKVNLTVKIIDVESGKVIFAKDVEGREVIGKVPNLTFDAIIGAAKKAAAEAVEDLRPELSRIFALRGHIIQLRTAPDKSERFALVNLGLKNGVKPGQEFYVLNFMEVEDPLTGKASCNVVKLPVTLVISDQILPNQAWGVLKGEKRYLMQVKLGQIVERKPLEGGSFMNKLF